MPRLDREAREDSGMGSQAQNLAQVLSGAQCCVGPLSLLPLLTPGLVPAERTAPG